ncbi:nickel/cobalt efflux transporter RcnA [Methylobacterium sp. BTF04]|uniref:nickel/cobalt efflux transporter n=1 Tax=Methylobacterium sp. BTF04 TaxID=2708300 RepID=UPI0013D08797|nr:nickel/cobalt efflux transporter [Methylobacterium sp. BTF04]NEU14074.1 nickel/cobalt efflux transporter RcnA [Methylobacterium sp. BTF04]
MTSLPELLRQGSAHAWLFVPSAILLGALHGLEPGHSKTMMAAFIVAVRGTVTQAVLLGLSATLSHTVVVWAVALAGLYLGQHWGSEATEPYFQIASAVVIVAIAAWMIGRTWAERRGGHHHPHHEPEVRRIATGGGGVATLAIYEDGVPPRWRLRFEGSARLAAGQVTLETTRPDGARQTFGFVDRGEHLESIAEIPEPHAFTASLHLVRGALSETHTVVFQEHDHDHDDAHARAHAYDIRNRFAGRSATTGQIVLFGLTGGLIPCPAAITVLLLCIQLKEISLGIVLVLCFSIGLALTMVAAGVVAALGVRHVARRWQGFDTLARRAPYVSGALIICVGLYTGFQGWSALHGHTDQAALSWSATRP